MIRQLLKVSLILGTLLALTSGAYAQIVGKDTVLVADISEDNVGITTTFHGTNLLLFGAMTGEAGDDVVIIISGPEGPTALRRKERVGGIWINTQSVTYKNAPSYYHIFSNRPLADVLTPSEQDRLKIGYQHLPLATNTTIVSQDTLEGEWRDALARTMRDADLWRDHPNAISVMAGALFRVDVPLPKNVRTGAYDVRILHFRDGVLLSEKFNSINVSKQGFGALMYRFAHEYSLFYGIFAVLFAVASGWLAAVAFRRS